MIEKQQIIEAADFLKSKKGLTFGEIAISIGENEQAIFNIRRGSKKPNALLVTKLVEMYPETAAFFATIGANDDIVQEPMILYNDGHTLKELVQTQKKLIENLEHRLLKETEDRRELEAEVKYLRARVMELEKLKKGLI